MKLHSPLYGKVVGDDEVTGDNDIVKVHILTHGPQLKAHGFNWGEAKEWSVIFKVSRVVNLPGSPLPLQEKEWTHASCKYIYKHIKQL